MVGRETSTAEQQDQPGTGDTVPARGVKCNQGRDDEGNDMQQDGFEIYMVIRMGKDSTTVILTFAGPDMAHYL